MGGLKMVRTTLALCGMLVLLTATAEAQTFGRLVEQAPAATALAASPIREDRPPSAAIDGQPGTSWGAPPGSSSAGIVIGLGEKRVLAGLVVDGHIEPDCELTVSWLGENEYLPFFGGQVSGGLSGARTLDLSLEHSFTDSLLLTITGPSASSCVINELMPLAFSRDSAARYLPPTAVVPGRGTSGLYAAEWLVDGDVRTTWRAGPWGQDSFDAPADSGRRAAAGAAGLLRKGRKMDLPAFFDTIGLENGVIFQYEKPVSVGRIKLYFKSTAKGDSSIYVENGDDWQRIATIPASSVQPGWMVVNLGTPVRGSNFKLTVTGDKGDVGDIGEVELWGTAPDSPSTVIQGEVVGSRADGAAVVRMMAAEKPRYVLEIATAGNNAEAFAVEANGAAITLPRVARADGAALYRALVDPDAFEGDDLWVTVPLHDSVKLLFARLRALDRDGEWAIPGAAEFNDGAIISAVNLGDPIRWDLGRKLSVDSIELRGPAAGSSAVRVLSGGEWTDHASASAGNDLSLVTCGRDITSVELRAFGQIAEATLQGSPTEDMPPRIRIISPDSDTTEPGNFLIGTVHDPGTSITVNGIAPRRYGPFFAVRLEDADPGADLEYQVSLKATDAQGRSITIDKTWYKSGLALLTVDQTGLQESTTADHFQVSGRVFGNQLPA